MHTNLTSTQKKRFEMLLMKVLDNEINTTEYQEFEQFITQNSYCTKEWQHYKRLADLIKSIKFQSPPKEVWEIYWDTICHRIE